MTEEQNTRSDHSMGIRALFDEQQIHQYDVGRTTVKVRRRKLKKLLDAIYRYSDEIKRASYLDQGKPELEVLTTEIYQITSEIKKARRDLSEWMDKQTVGTPISLLGASSYFRYEPKGVCLIISPWNFPFNLSFCPLVSAIAAGNTAIIKPSENTPHASSLIKKIVEDIFSENEVAVVEGGIESSTELLKLPFNHIFFTGSSAIGKIVMKAAAENLSSVTLELGGKSPTIIDETANIQNAAKRTAWGKFMNNGQICIAPDYVFVHEKKKDAFIKELKKSLQTFYGTRIEENEDYSRIVNEHHHARLESYLDDTEKRKLEFIQKGQIEKSNRLIEPTIVEAPKADSALMKNEIFGPILPIFSYSDINSVIDQINQVEKPLALYIYSDSSKNCDYIIQNTRAGGTVINNNNIQFSNGNLPFGGVNNSGIGKSHGFFGFAEFSNARAVMKQHIGLTLFAFMPPFKKWKIKIAELVVKWF
ncbi:MAG: aldehyde dehydrogenase family protein [Bacteroidota bacterium]